MVSRSTSFALVGIVCLVLHVDSKRVVPGFDASGTPESLLNETTRLQPPLSLLDQFKKDLKRLSTNELRSRPMQIRYQSALQESDAAITRAQNFVNDANAMGIPVGYSAQPAMGFFWELVNSAAAAFLESEAKAAGVAQQVPQAALRAAGLANSFSSGVKGKAEELLKKHGFANFGSAMLMRSRAELEAYGVLNLKGVPEFVDPYIHTDETTDRLREPVEGQWAYNYNEAWVSASVNMMQIDKMESALWFMKREASGGGSPTFYNALATRDQGILNLGASWAKKIIGPTGDYPVPADTFMPLVKDLVLLWAKLVPGVDAKVLHVILIAPQYASSVAYLSEAFGYLDKQMVRRANQARLQNLQPVSPGFLVSNSEFVQKVIALNQNTQNKWSTSSANQLRIRPYTRSKPNEQQDPPGTAPFAFYQTKQDEQLFQQWYAKITKVFQKYSKGSKAGGRFKLAAAGRKVVAAQRLTPRRK